MRSHPTTRWTSTHATGASRSKQLLQMFNSLCLEQLYRGESVRRLVNNDPRPLPRATEPLELDPQLRLICPVGGMILFSAAQMHSSVPNTSGVTRFSIDFRTVHLDDAAAKHGAPNIDSACSGTVMRDYLRCTDLSRIPEDVVGLMMTVPGLHLGELVYVPETVGARAGLLPSRKSGRPPQARPIALISDPRLPVLPPPRKTRRAAVDWADGRGLTTNSTLWPTPTPEDQGGRGRPVADLPKLSRNTLRWHRLRVSNRRVDPAEPACRQTTQRGGIYTNLPCAAAPPAALSTASAAD